MSRGCSEEDGGGDDHDDHRRPGRRRAGPRTARWPRVPSPNRPRSTSIESSTYAADEPKLSDSPNSETRAAPATSTTAPPTRSVASAQRRLPGTRRTTNCGRASTRDHDGAGNQHEPDQVQRDVSGRRRCRRSGRSPGAPATRPAGSTRRRAAGAAGRKPSPRAGRRKPGWARSGWSAATPHRRTRGSSRATAAPAATTATNAVATSIAAANRSGHRSSAGQRGARPAVAGLARSYDLGPVTGPGPR